ncbi:hypothetical protein CJ030_MR5G003576 [Morella rubra]|uniref:Uncharacterized protein n=1 Tax=Morella rubra TaxID=262757 RepID=A0A6A1VKT7_9ROSI|nr:hypothetical protein CJ030_MR5G003576 [Morella rubra]
MRVPEAGEKVSKPNDNELGFFDDALVTDCRFPLSPEIWELLFLYSLSPSQLALNGWRLVLAFFSLWRQLFAEENPQLWREFMQCNKIAKTDEGLYHFQARDKCGLLQGLPLNNKGWHEKFFLS